MLRKLFKYMGADSFPPPFFQAIEDDFYEKNDNQKLIVEIKSDEGSRKEAYRDQFGYWTIGVGHKIKDDEKYLMSEELSEKQIDALLLQDIGIAIKDANSVISNYNSLPDEIKGVIINMIFNLGRTRFSKFKKTIKAFENLDWEEAAKEMKNSDWYFQVPHRATRLIDRVKNFSA